jgi:hypothetical protein
MMLRVLHAHHGVEHLLKAQQPLAHAAGAPRGILKEQQVAAVRQEGSFLQVQVVLAARHEAWGAGRGQ